MDVERRRQALPVRSEVLHRFRMILLEGRRETKEHEGISFFMLSWLYEKEGMQVRNLTHYTNVTILYI